MRKKCTAVCQLILHSNIKEENKTCLHLIPRKTTKYKLVKIKSSCTILVLWLILFTVTFLNFASGTNLNVQIIPSPGNLWVGGTCCPLSGWTAFVPAHIPPSPCKTSAGNVYIEAVCARVRKGAFWNKPSTFVEQNLELMHNWDPLFVAVNVCSMNYF